MNKEEKMKCGDCDKQDDTVSSRQCVFQMDVHNDSNYWHTICDDCEYQHLLDI
jgi:hypothetical protein